MGIEQRRARLAMAAVLLTVLACLPTVGGTHRGTTKIVDATVSENVELPNGNWTAYTMTLGGFERLEYNVLVMTGAPIDVYFVAEAELANYASDTTSQFLLYTRWTNTLSAAGTFSEASGPISVIIDNTDIVLNDAQPSGPVTVFVTLTKTSSPVLGALIFIGCGIVLLAIALIVFLVLRRRKAAGEPLVPSPYGPPPYPSEQPPMEPFPEGQTPIQGPPPPPTGP